LKVIKRTFRHTHIHIRPITLPGPLKWTATEVHGHVANTMGAQLFYVLIYYISSVVKYVWISLCTAADSNKIIFAERAALWVRTVGHRHSTLRRVGVMVPKGYL